jgi:hypothetical protein
VESTNVPGNHPDTLRAIEQLTSLISEQNIADDKCAALRALARKFYGCRSNRRWTASEADVVHWGMIGCIVSIETRLRMLKPAPPVL